MMARDEREVVEVLKAELDFIEKGGYGRSVRTPWRSTVAFQDSPSCLAFPVHGHDEECVLMRFVPPELRSQSVPCHHIPLNDGGDTAAMLEQQGDQPRLEEAMKSWLRAQIKQLEDAHTSQVAVQASV
jgi:hypothetical protein